MTVDPVVPNKRILASFVLCICEAKNKSGQNIGHAQGTGREAVVLASKLEKEILGFDFIYTFVKPQLRNAEAVVLGSKLEKETLGFDFIYILL